MTRRVKPLILFRYATLHHSASKVSKQSSSTMAAAAAAAARAYMVYVVRCANVARKCHNYGLITGKLLQTGVQLL
jgi:hypothetical protein